MGETAGPYRSQLSRFVRLPGCIGSSQWVVSSAPWAQHTALTSFISAHTTCNVRLVIRLTLTEPLGPEWVVYQAPWYRLIEFGSAHVSNKDDRLSRGA